MTAPGAGPTVVSPDSAAGRRRAELVDLVTRQGYCTTLALSRALGVSDMTIRRDIRQLVQDGKLRSVRGGATVLPPAMRDGAGLPGAGPMRAAKRAIAARAVTLLPPSGAVAIDIGTTGLELALAIPETARPQVVTASLAVVNALAGHRNISLACLGGRLRRESQSFASTTAVQAVREMRLRTFFLAAAAVSADGVYCTHDIDAAVKRALAEAADEVVLLADSSKFSASAMMRVCPLDVVDRIVTDDQILPEQAGALAARGIDVIMVSARDGDGR